MPTAKFLLRVDLTDEEDKPVALVRASDRGDGKIPPRVEPDGGIRKDRLRAHGNDGKNSCLNGFFGHGPPLEMPSSAFVY